MYQPPDVRTSDAELLGTTRGIEHRHVPERGHPHGKPASWVLVAVVIAAFSIGGMAIIEHAWWLLWTCAGIVVLCHPGREGDRHHERHRCLGQHPSGHPGLASGPGGRAGARPASPHPGISRLHPDGGSRRIPAPTRAGEPRPAPGCLYQTLTGDARARSRPLQPVRSARCRSVPSCRSSRCGWCRCPPGRVGLRIAEWPVTLGIAGDHLSV